MLLIFGRSWATVCSPSPGYSLTQTPVPPMTDTKKTPTSYVRTSTAAMDNRQSTCDGHEEDAYVVYRPEATQVGFYPFFGRPLSVFGRIFATGCSPSPSYTPELLTGNTPNRQSRPRQTRRGHLLRTYVRVLRRLTMGSLDHDRHEKNTHMYRHSVLVTVHGRMSRSAPNFEQHNRTCVNSGEVYHQIQHIPDSYLPLL